MKVLRKLLARADTFPVFRLLLPFYALLAIIFAFLIHRGNMQLLNPAGIIAAEQAKILWAVIGFAAVVGALMIGSFFFVAFRYREGKQADYKPDWRAGPGLQLLGWSVPFLALSAISVMVWITAHQVDPYRAVASDKPPVTIQVVALRWKWLFIYPDEHIATVNTLEIPTNTPINFELTADAPMNSFWIPRLSGQIYAMTGMVTQLHVMATQPGTYAGGPAEISGDEFASMDFAVHAEPAADFAAWKDIVSEPEVSPMLSYATYQRLSQPSGYTRAATYRLAESNLFDAVVMKFMVPGATDITIPRANGGSL